MAQLVVITERALEHAVELELAEGAVGDGVLCLDLPLTHDPVVDDEGRPVTEPNAVLESITQDWEKQWKCNYYARWKYFH